ncbi:hypothetical protein [Corynebacterium pseudogenitalium]|uniref:Uncharacterized protein n=1 Tax=Corynebacterium pseudogenitalium TaxID=38303 RepID=A0ABD4TSI3_9CORY|nr:hypothetical protein [Corynebacterium pseudogenitalium]MCQ4614270.1 hypothetical protein [Corynebacterium pseudogenitalium]
MEPRSILRTYATAMVVCLALAIGTQILLGSSVEFMTMTLVCGIVEASTALLALGGAVWFTQAAWGRGYRRAVVTAWVAAVCLVVGWGSMAVARWEEYRAEMSLPIINLFMLLIPIGLVVLLSAVQLVRRR